MTRHTLKTLLFAGAALPLTSLAFVVPALAQQEDADTVAVETEAAADDSEVWDDAGMVAGAEDADAWASEQGTDTGDGVLQEDDEAGGEAAGGGATVAMEAPEEASAPDGEGAVEISANGGGSRNGTGGPDQ